MRTVSPSNPRFPVALLASGDVVASELLLREVLASEPQNATAHYQLARLLSQTGQREQAAQHMFLDDSAD